MPPKLSFTQVAGTGTITAAGEVTVRVHHADYLAGQDGVPHGYHLIIANPPWVRAQVLGALPSQALARRFGLRGRIDLGHAFVLALIDAMGEDGVLGAVLSNRFMTTRAGASLRRALRERLHLRRSERPIKNPHVVEGAAKSRAASQELADRPGAIQRRR